MKNRLYGVRNFIMVVLISGGIATQVEAQTLCSGGLWNAAGDKVVADVILRGGRGNFNWNVFSSGGEPVVWSSGSQREECNFSEGVCSFRFNFSMFTTQSADSVSAVITSGSADGWNCWFENIQNIAQGSGHITTYSPDTKSKAQFWGGVLAVGSNAFQICTLYSSLPDLVLACSILGAGTSVGGAYAATIAGDDPDYDYYNSFSPSYSDAVTLSGVDCGNVGDDTLRDICYGSGDALVQLDATASGARGNQNRYDTSCGDNNCVDQRKWDALWWGQQHGNALQTLSWEAGRIRDYCSQIGCDGYWTDLFDQQANGLWQVSQEEQGIN